MRAAEVLTLMADEQLGVPITPAVYRIRSREDTWTPVELNGTVHQNPTGSTATTGSSSSWVATRVTGRSRIRSSSC